MDQAEGPLGLRVSSSAERGDDGSNSSPGTESSSSTTTTPLPSPGGHPQPPAAATADGRAQPAGHDDALAEAGDGIGRMPGTDARMTSTEAAAAAAAAAEDAKKPRACESCRGLKVRCQPDANDPLGPCKRCAKAGRGCVVTQPTRKRQKKTDSRVAELEKKIDALTATLQATRGGVGLGAGAGGGDGGGGGGASAALLATSSPVPPPPSLAAPLRPILGLSPASSAGSGLGGSRDGNLPAKASEATAEELRSADSAVRSPPTPASAAANSAAASATSSLPNILNPASTSEWQPVLTDGPTSLVTGSNTRVNAYGIVFEKVDGGGGAAACQKRKLCDRDGPELLLPEMPRPPQQTMGPDYKDVIERGTLTEDQAGQLFARYTDRMVPHLPGVVFPEGTAWAQVRRDKPLLFLAVMAASSSETPAAQRELVKELMHIFAEKLVIVGEKSMEIVQALHVAVFWYWPPEPLEELKFYQMIHMAAVLAIDLGLGRKKPGVKGRHIPWSWKGDSAVTTMRKNPPPDPCSVEARRTWLTCYLLASNASMTLHRPYLLRWTPFMAECVRVLETSPEAARTDRYLCHLVWTHRLSEEVALHFAMDDPAAPIDFADQRTQHAIRGFERDMDRYRASLAPDQLQPSLRLSFHVLSLYMHEIALRNESPPDEAAPGVPQADGSNGADAAGTSGGGENDGSSHTRNTRAPATSSSSPSTPTPDDDRQPGRQQGGARHHQPQAQPYLLQETLTAAHVHSLSACLTAIEGIFNTFLSMDPDSVRCLPVFNFVRVAYATVVLIKMYFAASSPGSELGRIFRADEMKVEHYLDGLLEKFRQTAADDRSRPAAKFHLVLTMLCSWFKKQGQQAAAAAAPDAAGADDAAAAAVKEGSSSSPPSAVPPDRTASAVASARTPLRGNSPSFPLLYHSPHLPTPPQRPPSQGEQPLHRRHGTHHHNQYRHPHPPRQHSHPRTAHQNHLQQASAAMHPPPQPSYAAANTPLHLLSEIATNDAGAGLSTLPPTSTGSGPGTANANANANARAALAPATPTWFHPTAAPQPFMYEPGGGSDGGPAPPPPASGPPPPASASGPPPISSQQQPQQQQQQWMGNDFDPGSLGDGSVQAMDLTYGGVMMYDLQGLGDLGGGGGTAGMRSILVSEPWFDGMLDSSMLYHF